MSDLMAAQSAVGTSPKTFIVLLIFGLALTLWMLAMLTNFRGYRDGYLRRMTRTTALFGNRSPLPEGTTPFLLVFSALFLLAGLVLVVVAILGLTQ